jgi:multiple sugar transport system substrate-binding protein
MRRLVILLVCLVVFVVPVFAGGSKQDSETGGSAGAQGGEVSADGIAWKKYSGTTLNLGMNKHVYTDTLRTVIDEFRQKTGIKIVIDEYAEDQFINKRLIDLSSGVGTFDIVMMDYTCGQAAQAGWIENLTPWFNRRDLVDRAAYNIDDISSSFRAGYTFSNGLYAIPVTGEKQILFYRKDVFEQKGIKIPQTYEELAALAKRFKDEKEFPCGILLRAQNIHTVWNTTGMIWSYGGRIADDPIAYNKAVFNSPGGYMGADMYTSLAREYGPPGVANYTWYEAVSDFQQGKGPMYIDSSVFMNNFEDPSGSTVAGKVGYAVVPAGSAGRFASGNAWGISMSSASKNKDAAFLFLAWVSGPDVCKTIAVNGGITARGTSLSNPEMAKKYPKEWLAAMEESYKLEMPEPTLPTISKSAEFLDVFGRALNSLVLRKQDLKPVMDKAAADVTKIFLESRE